MKTKKYLLLLFAIILIVIGITSCKRSKRDMLARTWHAVSLHNPQMDIIVSQGQNFIDTVGQSTDAQANIEIYGTDDMDSFKKQAQEKLDSIKALQMDALTNTWFKFRKDGVAILSFTGYVDSTKWSFNDEGDLVLDELAEQGAGDKIKMQVEELNDTVLKLNFSEGNISSSVTFHPAEK